MSRSILLIAVTSVLAGCRGDNVVEPLASAPDVVSAGVGPNPHNALSAVVTFRAERADSARLLLLTDSLHRDSTPYVATAEPPDTIVALELRPSTGYRAVVEAAGRGGTAHSDTVSFTTAPLPELLQRVGIKTSGTGGAGLTLTSIPVGGSSVFALAFDSSGAIRWYRQFQGNERFAGELKQQANGLFTLYRGSSTGVEPVPGHIVQFTAAGDSVRAITVAPPRYLDNHDFWITRGPDGGERFHFYTYDHRTSDLTGVGGADAVSLAGHQLIRLRADGEPGFEWNAWDRVGLDEWIEPPRPGPQDSIGRDFDHPNSLSFDLDGNYLVSFRHLSQILNIDARTGEVRWRLGGRRNEFTFVNDPLGGFSAQHSANMLPNGNLLLYDNGTSHQPRESRAVEYALGPEARTATLVWEFRHTPPIYTPAVGGAQRLRNGNTLVGFGFVGHADEVTRDGNIVWEADISVDGEPAFVYRLVRIASLYGYREP